MLPESIRTLEIPLFIMPSFYNVRVDENNKINPKPHEARIREDLIRQAVHSGVWEDPTDPNIFYGSGLIIVSGTEIPTPLFIRFSIEEEGLTFIQPEEFEDWDEDTQPVHGANMLSAASFAVSLLEIYETEDKEKFARMKARRKLNWLTSSRQPWFPFFHAAERKKILLPSGESAWSLMVRCPDDSVFFITHGSDIVLMEEPETAKHDVHTLRNISQEALRAMPHIGEA
ncbi:MAG: hypothetical protein COY40_06145 [Alphaproteobacteria bacterium CG_4_10_14_0_8_um_filter_53_9]|nr:MAG: hypothetical protein COY40_06145 [Alphaproteobacteria bacterium CG_4_10_14_0_8_um_filter_53_9]